MEEETGVTVEEEEGAEDAEPGELEGGGVFEKPYHYSHWDIAARDRGSYCGMVGLGILFFFNLFPFLSFHISLILRGGVGRWGAERVHIS